MGTSLEDIPDLIKFDWHKYRNQSIAVKEKRPDCKIWCKQILTMLNYEGIQHPLRIAFYEVPEESKEVRNLRMLKDRADRLLLKTRNNGHWWLQYTEGKHVFIADGTANQFYRGSPENPVQNGFFGLLENAPEELKLIYKRGSLEHSVEDLYQTVGSNKVLRTNKPTSS